MDFFPLYEVSHGKGVICVQNLAIYEEVTGFFHHDFILFFFQGPSSFKAEKPWNKCVGAYEEENYSKTGTEKGSSHLHIVANLNLKL